MDLLSAYGFVKDVGGFLYTERIMDGQFEVRCSVSDAGIVTAKVVDLATDETYAPVNVEMSTGGFVGAVREAYRAVLRGVAHACCRRQYFASPTANRLAAAVYARYGETPDFPFATAPTYGVFRYPPNRKWYGLVMDIPLYRLTGERPPEEEAPTVDVLNVKIDPAERESLLAMRGFYPCYHMNKTGWISILLDDSVPDDLLMDLVDKSRQAVVETKTKRGKS